MPKAGKVGVRGRKPLAVVFPGSADTIKKVTPKSMTEKQLPLTPAIKTTGLAGGMHHAFKAMMPAARYGL